jgi:hypothetical protein
MSLRASRLLLGVWVAAGLACPAMAQQSPPPQSPPQGLSYDAFTRNSEGDWIAKREVTVTVPSASGTMLLKAGQQVDDQLQERLDDQCKIRPPQA